MKNKIDFWKYEKVVFESEKHACAEIEVTSHTPRQKSRLNLKSSLL